MAELAVRCRLVCTAQLASAATRVATTRERLDRGRRRGATPEEVISFVRTILVHCRGPSADAARPDRSWRVRLLARRQAVNRTGWDTQAPPARPTALAAVATPLCVRSSTAAGVTRGLCGVGAADGRAKDGRAQTHNAINHDGCSRQAARPGARAVLARRPAREGPRAKRCAAGLVARASWGTAHDGPSPSRTEWPARADDVWPAALGVRERRAQQVLLRLSNTDGACRQSAPLVCSTERHARIPRVLAERCARRSTGRERAAPVSTRPAGAGTREPVEPLRAKAQRVA